MKYMRIFIVIPISFQFQASILDCLTFFSIAHAAFSIALTESRISSGHKKIQPKKLVT
jgi:hypothetical protein